MCKEKATTEKSGGKGCAADCTEMKYCAPILGLLLAALYDPVWTSAIFTPGDFGLALAAFVLLVLWKVPPWLVVILCAHG